MKSEKALPYELGLCYLPFKGPDGLVACEMVVKERKVSMKLLLSLITTGLVLALPAGAQTTTDETQQPRPGRNQKLKPNKM